MKAKFLILSLAAFAALSSYADDTDYTKAIQIKLVNGSGLVIGGTDKPILVEEADNDDSQVFYMVQSSHSNWADGRPATYPGYFLVQKSSGKYIVEASYDNDKKSGTLVYGDKPEFISNGNGKEPTCKGHWVPNDNAANQGVRFQISLNQESHRFCAIDKDNNPIDSDIPDALLGKEVGLCGTPGLMSTAFDFVLHNYTGDIWVRGSGLTGSSAGWETSSSFKLEKDASNPGVYYHNKLTISSSKMLKICLQNDAANSYILCLSPIYNSAQLIPFTVGDIDEFKFVPWSFYHAWQVSKDFGVYNISLDMNMMTLTVNKGEGNYQGGSGVAEIEAAEDAPAHYYNLQGVEVTNPENGVYIRVSGNKATKVIKH